VLDGVGMVLVSVFEDLLNAVCGRPRLALAAAHDLRGAPHIRAACSLVEVTIVVGHGLLAAWFAPFLAAPGALLGILNGNIGRRSPATARSWVKLGRPNADSVMGGNAALLNGGVLKGINRCLEGSH
jgi:hypothetical protein